MRPPQSSLTRITNLEDRGLIIYRSATSDLSLMSLKCTGRNQARTDLQ